MQKNARKRKRMRKEIRRDIWRRAEEYLRYTKANVIFFKSKQEEKQKLENDFNGFFVRVHPDVPNYAEILEVISKEGIQRPIAITNIITFDIQDDDNDEYLYNKQEAAAAYADNLIVDVARNYYKALDDRSNSDYKIHVDIAISVELEERLFGSYKSKK